MQLAVFKFGKYCLISHVYPEVREEDFFVRGQDKSLNETRCCVVFDEYLDIYGSIKAYNRDEYFCS